MSIRQRLLADFQKEAALTRRLLEAVPEDQLGFKPHEKSMTLGMLAGHIVESATWTREMVGPEFDFASVGDYQPFVPSSVEELLAKHDEAVAAVPEYLDGRDDAFMNETWIMRAGDTVMVEEPRHEIIRSMTIHHVAHHRGQLTVYLRLLGQRVPGLYGPTADDKPPT